MSCEQCDGCRKRLGFAGAVTEIGLLAAVTSKRTLALHQRVELVGTVDNSVGRTWDLNQLQHKLVNARLLDEIINKLYGILY